VSEYGQPVAGDDVWDLDRQEFGTVRKDHIQDCDVENWRGQVWQAKRYNLRAAIEVTSAKPPPGHVPLEVYPHSVQRMDHLFLAGSFYPVQDMRTNGAGGRVLHLQGWPGGLWVITRGVKAWRPLKEALKKKREKS
jgi:hypothetical protein